MAYFVAGEAVGAVVEDDFGFEMPAFLVGEGHLFAGALKDTHHLLLLYACRLISSMLLTGNITESE